MIGLNPHSSLGVILGPTPIPPREHLAMCEGIFLVTVGGWVLLASSDSKYPILHRTALNSKDI